MSAPDLSSHDAPPTRDRGETARSVGVGTWLGRSILAIAIGVMATTSLYTIREGLRGLVWQSDWTLATGGGAIDLRLRHREVQRWFAGLPARDEGDPETYITYPPASYMILWPLLGWMPLEPARGFWAMVSLAGLAWLCVLLARESRARSALEYAAAALIPLSMVGTRVCLANGQLAILLVPLLVTGALMLAREECDWRCDMMGSALMLGALVKPTFAAPFILVVLVTLRRLRPAALIAGAYAVLTLIAVSFQPTSRTKAMTEWLRHGATSLATPRGQANLQAWLVGAGFGRWVVPASLLALGALAVWLYHHREDEPWILLGVTGIVARMWTYHWSYDDLLLLLPMVTLARLAGDAATPRLRRGVAATLLALGWLTLLDMPWTWGLTRIPGWYGAQSFVWLAVLVFLACQPRRVVALPAVAAPTVAT
ncbi:MAG: glycosyltransferase family 87 protein [Thermoanaerobaculaceae bacterium]